ncbi:MAG: nucleotide exchange factor GrpE [Rhodocyclaceae bacterium]|nr:nucleotide exchange factor GrpE [Rhodocyclaceae bacterium]
MSAKAKSKASKRSSPQAADELKTNVSESEALYAEAPASAAESEDAPAADAAQADNAQQQADEVARLQVALNDLQDQLLRARAEVENVRRRAQDEVGKASKFAIEKFAAALLPVKDSLESALTTENQTLDNLREGVELTLRQLESAFTTGALVEDNPLHQKFDPTRHQAISAVPAPDVEPNTVVTVLQKGYLINERVLRPALVMVAQAAS